MLAGGVFAGTTLARASPIEPGECRIMTSAATTVDEAMRLPPQSCGGQVARRLRGTIWLDYRDTQALAGQTKPWRMMVDNHRVGSIDLYLLRADGSRSHVAYDPTAADRDWMPGNYLVLPIAVEAAPITRMMVRLGDSELVTRVRATQIAPENVAAHNAQRSSALFGMAVGVLGVTILFHLVLFFAIKRRFQLLYCAHVTMLFIYGFCYSSLILLPVPELSATSLSRTLASAMAFATVTAIAFISDFIEGDVLPRWLRHWAKGAAAMSFTAGAALLAAPLAWTGPAYTLGYIAAFHALGIITAMLVGGVMSGSPTARVLILAWALPIGTALLYPLRGAGLISDTAIPDGAMVFALTFECLVLSLPVANRIKALRIDHERARERQLVLERQAQTDVLTGLSNRRGFVAAMDRSFTVPGPNQAALMMIDIDHFKLINDRHGHGRGDCILQRVADHVARSAGAGAIVARYGGEEFVIAIRGYDAKRAATLAERIRIGIENLPCDLQPPSPLTVSIGVACGASDAIDQLIAEADQALYAAKDRGRNCVVLATGDTQRTRREAAAA